MQTKPNARTTEPLCPGFTLIESLVVISIISVLASLTLVAIQEVKARANETAPRAQIALLDGGLELFRYDEDEFPGQDEALPHTENRFPVLYDALLGTPQPRGPGGRSAPYINLKEEHVAVYDTATGEHRMARRREIRDPKVVKVLVDPWGNPYVYRLRDRRTTDIYSIGRNEADDTIARRDNSDDIGNW